jgi:hypothetical protein
MTPGSESEGNFLVAILNSETARNRSEQYQARGQFGARHFDKVIFNQPIPRFDPKNKLHLNLAEAAARAETLAATIQFPEGVKFQRARRMVRDLLKEAGISGMIDALVMKLLDDQPNRAFSA